MLKLLKKHNRLEETIFLGVLSFLSLCFSVFRVLFSGGTGYLFLHWNLFLAFLPWAFSSIAILRPKIWKYWLAKIIVIALWLLFFPNALYILTDLFHLRYKAAMPIWYDLILVLFFAWTGLMFGFLSLWDIERLLKKSLNNLWVKIIVTLLIFITSFGIYVGRYMRWNSWDIITEPLRVLDSIGYKFLDPLDNPGTWGLTLFMGLFLNMVYWSFKLIIKRESKNAS